MTAERYAVSPTMCPGCRAKLICDVPERWRAAPASTESARPRGPVARDRQHQVYRPDSCRNTRSRHDGRSQLMSPLTNPVRFTRYGSASETAASFNLTIPSRAN